MIKKINLVFEDDTTRDLILSENCRANEVLYSEGKGINSISLNLSSTFSKDMAIECPIKELFKELTGQKIKSVAYLIDDVVIMSSNKILEVKYNFYDTHNTTENGDVLVLIETISFFIK